MIRRREGRRPRSPHPIRRDGGIFRCARARLAREALAHLRSVEVPVALLEVHLPGEEHEHLEELRRGPRGLARALPCRGRSGAATPNGGQDGRSRRFVTGCDGV